MARKIFYISDYWRVLKILVRIHIEAYGLGDGGVGGSATGYGSHLLDFTKEREKNLLHCFKWLVHEIVNNLVFGDMLKIARHSGDSTFNPIMISIRKFGEKQKTKEHQ